MVALLSGATIREKKEGEREQQRGPSAAHLSPVLALARLARHAGARGEEAVGPLLQLRHEEALPAVVAEPVAAPQRVRVAHRHFPAHESLAHHSLGNGVGSGGLWGGVSNQRGRSSESP